MAVFKFIQRALSRFRLKSALNLLNQLQSKTFFIYLKHNYAEKHYFYEKELHQERLRFFSVIIKLHHSDVSKKLLQKIDEFFEIVTALGSLRYRINDHAILEVCELELLKITQSITLLFKQVIMSLTKRNLKIDTSVLLTQIQALESNYQHTLSVVLKEPMDFLIFIQDLYALKEKFDLISTVNNL